MLRFDMLIRSLVCCCLAGLTTVAQADELRLISAGASITALVRALDLEQSLVGVDSTSLPLVAGSDLPNIGYPRTLSAEGLLSLTPDVLLGSEEMGPPAVVEQLRQAGVEVIVLSAEASLETLFANIEQVGLRFDRQAAANDLRLRLQASIDALPPIREPRPEALFLLSHSAGSLLVAGDNTVGNSLIVLGGMSNPVAGRFGQYRALSAEAFLQLRPQWLLTTSQSLDMAGSVQALLALQPALQATPAGRSGQVLGVDGTQLVGGFSPEITATLLQLRQAALATPQ